MAKVFEPNPAGLNWPRAVMFLDAALVPLVVFLAVGHEQYLLSAEFGSLFAAVADPGGGYGYRASRFAALLLNVWFIVALGLASSLHHRAHITSDTWAQVLAWAGGSALWIVVTFVAWLIRGRQDRPQPVAELPGDTSRRSLTRKLIMFAVIRALAIAGSVALAGSGCWPSLTDSKWWRSSSTRALARSGDLVAGAAVWPLPLVRVQVPILSELVGGGSRQRRRPVAAIL